MQSFNSLFIYNTGIIYVDCLFKRRLIRAPSARNKAHPLAAGRAGGCCSSRATEAAAAAKLRDARHPTTASTSQLAAAVHPDSSSTSDVASQVRCGDLPPPGDQVCAARDAGRAGRAGHRRGARAAHTVDKMITVFLASTHDAPLWHLWPGLGAQCHLVTRCPGHLRRSFLGPNSRVGRGQDRSGVRGVRCWPRRQSAQ